MLESYRDLTDEQLIAALKNSGDPDGKIMDYILEGKCSISDWR